MHFGRETALLLPSGRSGKLSVRSCCTATKTRWKTKCVGVLKGEINFKLSYSSIFAHENTYLVPGKACSSPELHYSSVTKKKVRLGSAVLQRTFPIGPA
jgi:hypothetical protein